MMINKNVISYLVDRYHNNISGQHGGGAACVNSRAKNQNNNNKLTFLKKQLHVTMFNEVVTLYCDFSF